MIKPKLKKCNECNQLKHIWKSHEKEKYCKQCWVIKNINKTKKANSVVVTSHDIIDDLDFVFSRYIRIKESDKNGNVSCYTCGKISHWKEIQCGHFIKRGQMQLRWDNRNARPQCPECNVSLYGNIYQYEKNLNEEQSGLPEQLREISREVYKHSREELKELLSELRAKLAIVESRFVQ